VCFYLVMVVRRWMSCVLVDCNTELTNKIPTSVLYCSPPNGVCYLTRTKFRMVTILVTVNRIQYVNVMSEYYCQHDKNNSRKLRQKDFVNSGRNNFQTAPIWHYNIYAYPNRAHIAKLHACKVIHWSEILSRYEL
jgi:hypothetical protein